MLNVFATMDPLDSLRAMRAWEPIMPVAVGLIAQETQDPLLAGVATKAMEREELAAS